jgi:CTP:molybdopterin cytidylyltransferase MocA
MIGGVLLAAGAGTRFRAGGGGVKVLAPVEGRPLVEWALAALAAAPLGDRVLVLGADGDDVLAAIDLQGARVVRNEHWERGMASSLRAGLDALDASCTAAVVVLGDGPALAAEAIRRVALAAEAADGLVSARYGDRNGHPVAIPRTLWARLPDAGEQGARVLGPPAVLVDCSDLPAPGDADTPAELGRARRV